MAQRLVIYDSFFGNTAKIAEAIGEAIDAASVKNISEVDQTDLDGLEVLFVGSPTRAFRPTPAITTFLKELPKNHLAGVKAAAFDTRIGPDQINSGFLRLMIKLFGYADKIIAKQLAKAGAELPLESEGFSVTDTEGPLAEDEIERAKAWAKKIL